MNSSIGGCYMQMAERKKQAERRKRGEPGSKEAEVFLLQEAMEERNQRNVSNITVKCQGMPPALLRGVHSMLLMAVVI